MVHGQGKGWSWLSVKLLHHLGLNWVFPWIVQWRFGRDLSWVAYSHLDIRLVTEVYTNRERYMQNTFLAYLCVLFCFFAWKLAVAVWSPCPIVATRKFHFPLQFRHFSPSIFPRPNIFSDQYLTPSWISTRSIHFPPTDVHLSKKEAPSSSIPISPGPLPAYLRVNFLLFQVIWAQNIFQIIFHLTLQFSGLVCGLGTIGIRGSRSKVDFQSSSYGFSQTIPRSGAMNEDCLHIVIWQEKKQNVWVLGWCWISD